MATIQFDILVPPEKADEVRDAFQRALDILVRRDMLTAGSVRMEPELIDDSIEAQLRTTYEQNRGEPADDAVVHRLRADVEGARSLNSLAMGLSRILTPKAELPRDPAQLQQEERFELPSIYPWVVEVFR